MTIRELFDRYLSSRPELGELSRVTMAQSGLSLSRYLPGPVKGITPAKADDAKAKMMGDMKPVTVQKHVRFARQVWDWAVARQEIARNPWASVKILVRANDEPVPEVSRECVLRVMRHARPDVACLLALCRFAGLRKSEALFLGWDDVGTDEITVRARSGEVTTKQATRKVPIDKRLGESLGIARDAGLDTPTGNLRFDTHLPEKLLKVIKAAGVVPWPKMLQTLRANCETDWRQAGIDIFDAAKWMGHSAITAYKHYHVARKESAQKLRDL